jgi:hypothetical protein
VQIVPQLAHQPSYDSFDPRQYLRQNYSTVEYNGNEPFLQFLVAAYRGVGPNAVLLEFGGGPALCSPLAAAHLREIHFCDYLEANLHEVRLWMEGRAEAFDWTAFARRILEIESGRAVDDAEVFQRCATLRSKLKLAGRCDARAGPPLVQHPNRHYDVVSANFVINAATPSRDLLDSNLANICSMLEPGGTLVLTSSVNRPSYRVGRQQFGLVPLGPDDLTGSLRRIGFPEKELAVSFAPSDEYGRTENYIFIRAVKA